MASERLGLAAAYLWLGACASVPPEAGFDEVATLARERGGHELVWRRGGPEDAALDARVHELLARPLAVEDAVAIALLSNRRLQALYAELGFAQADVLAAARLPNPLFHAEVRFPSGGGLSALDFGLEQSFLGLLLMPLKKRLAAEAFEAAQLRVTAGALTLAHETRAAYWRALGAEQRGELARTALEAAEAALELAQRLHDAGNLRALDLELERAQREDARVAVADAELLALEAREALVARLGLYGAGLEFTLGERLPEPPPADEVPAELEARAIESSLALAITRHEIERAGTALGLADRTALVPSLELGLAYEREPDGEGQLGPTLALPLPIFSQGQPEKRRAAAELERLRATYLAQAVELRSRARAGAARVQALHGRATFLRESVLPLRQRILDGLQLEYNAMQEGAFRLLLAKRELLAAGAAYTSTLSDYWVARSALDGLLAGVDPEPGDARSLSASTSFTAPDSGPAH